MVVRLRLARMGHKNQPWYNITVSDNMRGLSRKPIEVIGTYRATPKEIPGNKEIKMKEVELDFSRARYWLGVGAWPSDTVADIFRRFDIYPKKDKKKAQSKREKPAASTAA